MKSRSVWVFAAMLFSLVLLVPLHAKAEFCPAHVQKVVRVTSEPGVFSVRLTAGSQRHVTGQFFVETSGGWFRAPFAPVQLSKTADGIVSPFITVDLHSAQLMNVWLAQTASDDPSWAGHETVFCAPAPERLIARETVARAQLGVAVASTVQSMPAPLSYHCATPFAPARVETDDMDAIPYGPGEYASALLDIDASGKVVDVTPVDASNDDFTLRNDMKQRVMHMPVTPAIAYCRPVPTTLLLREGVPTP